MQNPVQQANPMTNPAPVRRCTPAKHATLGVSALLKHRPRLTAWRVHYRHLPELSRSWMLRPRHPRTRFAGKKKRPQGPLVQPSGWNTHLSDHADRRRHSVQPAPRPKLHIGL